MFMKIVIGLALVIGAIAYVAFVRSVVMDAERSHFPVLVLLAYIAVETVKYGALIALCVWLISLLYR